MKKARSIEICIQHFFQFKVVFSRNALSKGISEELTNQVNTRSPITNKIQLAEGEQAIRLLWSPGM